MRTPTPHRGAALAAVSLLAALCPLTTALPPAAAATVTDTLGQCGYEESVWATSTPFALDRLGTSDVWEVTRGEGVVVAVVDAGVEADNPHLSDALVPGVSLIPGDPEPQGTSAVDNHGTAIASLIAAREVEGSTLVGIAPQARVMPVRVFVSQDQNDIDAGNGLRADRIAEGIRWAVDNGADIVTLSVSSTVPDPLLEEAVAYARAHDVLLVASVGNAEFSGDTEPRWPASYDGVLGVSATTTGDEVTDASVSGPAVDVTAPGQQVVSAWLGEKDCINSPDDQAPQTSWATAYVSAVAALVAAAHPEASADEIAYRIMSTADRPVRSQRDDVQGWGLVQPHLAVTSVVDPERAGPPVPGAAATGTSEGTPRTIRVGTLTDASAATRRAALWWAALAVAAVCLLTLVRVWTAARKARRDALG